MTSSKTSPALVVMICLLLWAIGSQLWSAVSWGHDSWQMSEWLINYAGGFVRRGLTGWMIGGIADVTGMRANHVAMVIGFVCYLVLTVWFLRRATRVFPTALILSCMVMGFPAYQDSIVRKDCLGLLLLLACLTVDGGRLARWLAVCAVNLIAAFAILSHEAFAFYALPALVLYSRRSEDGVPLTGLLWRCLALLPAAGCFILVSVFHGTPAHAQAVNDSWIPLWRAMDPAMAHPEIPAASIQALGWTAGKGLSLGVTLLTSGFYQPMAWAALFVISFALVVWFTERAAERGEAVAMDGKTRVTVILLMQLAAVAPLFLLGYDYGRWLFLWLGSSLMIHAMDRRPPRPLVSAVSRLFDLTIVRKLIARVPARDWYLLFFGVPVCWNVHAFIDASPIMRHLRIIGSWF